MGPQWGREVRIVTNPPDKARSPSRRADRPISHAFRKIRVRPGIPFVRNDQLSGSLAEPISTGEPEKNGSGCSSLSIILRKLGWVLFCFGGLWVAHRMGPRAAIAELGLTDRPSGRGHRTAREPANAGHAISDQAGGSCCEPNRVRQLGCERRAHPGDCDSDWHHPAIYKAR